MTNSKSFRIMITNDDGYRAEGIKELEAIARTITDDVWVVAPSEQQSGMGHALTYRDPLRVTKHGEKHYSVDGTPTDSVIIGIRKILADHKPDLVLSGVNNGENVAESFTHSGTIGAAIEATLHGVKAIAFSQVTLEKYPVDWTVTKELGPSVLKTLLKQDWSNNTLLNVNFPLLPVEEVAGIKVCRQGRRSDMGGMVECLDPRGKPYYWVGVLHNEVDPVENTDLWGVAKGYVTVTPVTIDLTDHTEYKRLSQCLDADFSASVKKAV
jgi:5'-nucleotidase